MKGGADALNYVGASAKAALDLLSGNQTSVVVHVAGAVSQISVLEVEEGGTAKVEVAGAGLAVPASALASLGLKDAIVALTVLQDNKILETLASADESGDELEVLGAVDINLYSKDKESVSVSGVPEPFVITIPLDDPSSANECAFWDESLGRFNSLPLVGKGDGVIMCETSHFTLFSAIFRGFLNAIMCANFDLLTPASFAMLGKNGWYFQPIALVFWAALSIIGAMWVRACVKDHYGEHAIAWSDECWLLPLNTLSEEEAIRANAEEAVVAPTGVLAVCACCSCGAGASNAARDALDDLLERLFQFVGEVRTLLEGILSEFDIKSLCTGTFFVHQCNIVVGAMVASSARRQAAAKMGLSEEIVSFVLEDEDLQELLIKHISNRRNGIEDPRTEAWLALHQQVLEEVDTHWHEKSKTGWWHMPFMTAKLFIVSNPVLSTFLSCRIVSHNLRMLFFCTDLFGAFMMAAVFFDGSGMTVSRRSKGECDAELGPGEQIGRTLAISLCSLVLAGIPVSLIQSLHTRAFYKFHHRGCPEWNRKLRAWRVQDKMLVVCGGSYIAFCILFLCLFLANTQPDDLPDFGVSCFVQVTADTVIIPMATAIIVPCLAIAGIRLLAKFHRRSVKELLKERRSHLNGKGNWRHLVASV